MANSAARAEKPMLIDDDDDDIMLVEDESVIPKAAPKISRDDTPKVSPAKINTAQSGFVQSSSSSTKPSASSVPSHTGADKPPHTGTRMSTRSGADKPSHTGPHMIKNINSYISQVKTASKKAENEIELMRRSLKSMESSLGDAMYEKLKYLVEEPGCLVVLPVDNGGLESMIQEVVKEAYKNEKIDVTDMEMQSINRRLDSIEGANHTVSKMFLECHSKLKRFGQNLAEESKRVNDEIAHYESILSLKTINIIDDDDEEDDDDDVKIVDETTASEPPPPQPPPAASHSLEGMSIKQLRSRFANAVQTQMPGLLNTLNNQQAHAASKISTLPTPNPVMKNAAPSSSSLSTQKPMDSTTALAALVAGNQLEKAVVWPTLVVNDKVMGKKFNDVWYPGHVQDIYPPDPPQEQEWRCKVRFNKGMKILPGRHVGYKETLKCVVKVGTRVVALYKEEDSPNTMYAGIIAEAPSMKNNKRFLVFFDDGYAQYCHASEVHKVYMQSENVWEDIHPDTRSFIKDYLDIYPERPMVRLAKGQVVKTEWNGKWWTAKVVELDASLVKMVFQADRRTEWIYRGSTRLEPLFRALTNANAIKAAGSSRGRRLNLTMKPSDVHRKPAVEYTRGVSMDDESGKGGHSKTTRQAVASSSSSSSAPSRTQESKKKSNVARKSTGGAPNLGAATSAASTASAAEKWEAPWLKYQRKSGSSAGPSSGKQDASGQVDMPDLDMTGPETTGAQPEKGRSNRTQSKHAKAAFDSLKKSQDIATVLQERLAQSSDHVEYDEHVETGKRRDITIDNKGKSRNQFVPHHCSPACLGDMEEVLDDSQKMKGTSPLLIPLMCFWERQVCKARPNPKRYVIYRGPCGRRLRTLSEVDRYLQMTNSNLGIDLFSFDHNLHVSREFVPIKTFCDIKDLSYGIENYPISCVNGVDRHYPDYVEYYNYRIPAKGVNLNLNPDFLACCDCTDNCRDRSKCACQQLTLQNTSCVGSVDTEAGYHNRRLREPLFTGIFECNANCPCDKRCHNKVAQLGLRMRLQVFRTEKKGWGLRCLDDIAKGSFICIYAGQLLTDRGANEDGKQYGDEYLAELDFMEVVEGQKEGYESDVEFSEDDKDHPYEEGKDSEDSDYSSGATGANIANVGERRKSLRRKTKKKDEGKDSSKDKEKPSSKSVSRTGSVEMPGTPISISDDDEDSKGSNDDKKEGKNEEGGAPTTTGASQDDKAKTEVSPNAEVRRRAKKSTGGSRLNLSYSSVHKSSEPEETANTKQKKPERLPTRSYFHDDTECYIMDAKSMGNLGRYLNHSCSPNVFVQNVFVDTHDLRFPWVAFFAGEYIRAGTELTWDYNYEVGSVPDKILYCYCGSSMCRGRLL